MPTEPERLPSRRTRTIAIRQPLHDQLRLIAAQQSMKQGRRVSMQELVEAVLTGYLDDQAPHTSLHDAAP